MTPYFPALDTLSLTAAWQAVERLAQSSRPPLAESTPETATPLVVEAAGLRIDVSRQRLSGPACSALRIALSTFTRWSTL